MKLAILAARIAAVVFALLFVAAGFFILWIELRVAPVHTVHVYVAAGLILVGGLAIIPAQIVGGVKQLLGVVGPYVPWKRTSTAAPAPSSEPPVNDQ